MLKINPFLLLLLPLLLLAQEAAEQEVPQLDIHFSVFPLQGGDWQGIYYAAEFKPEELTELEFNRQERSISYRYQGPSPLLFFRKEINEEGEPVLKTVARVDLKAEGEHSMILFFDPADAEGRHPVHVMQDSETHFPSNSLVFYNTMKIPFVTILGSQRLQVPPGASPAYDMSPFFGEEVPIAMAIHQDEDYHLVLQNKMRFAPERRTLIILRPPTRPNSLRIRTQRLTEFTGERAKDEPPEDAGSTSAEK